MISLCTSTLVPGRNRIAGSLVLSLADAAAAAGFDGVSLWHMHHRWAVADGIASEEFFEHHRALGLDIPCVEVVFDWLSAEPTAASQAALDVAGAARARSVIAITLDARLPPLGEAGRRLAALCDRAADQGIRVSIEPIPFTGIPDVTTAGRLIDAADRHNLGIVLDLWHFHRRGEPDLDSLRRFPADRIDVVQLDDALAVPWADLRAETESARLLPGEGAIAIEAILDVLDRRGASPVVAAEVYSSALVELGPPAMAAAIHDASRAVLGERFR